MKGKFTIIPLATDPSYEFSINLGKFSYKFIFNLNGRQGIYHFDVYKDNATLLWSGLPLIPGPYSLYKFPDSEAFLVLLPKSADKVPRFANVDWKMLPELYTLVYVE